MFRDAPIRPGFGASMSRNWLGPFDATAPVAIVISETAAQVILDQNSSSSREDPGISKVIVGQKDRRGQRDRVPGQRARRAIEFDDVRDRCAGKVREGHAVVGDVAKV